MGGGGGRYTVEDMTCVEDAFENTGRQQSVPSQPAVGRSVLARTSTIRALRLGYGKSQESVLKHNSSTQNVAAVHTNQSSRCKRTQRDARGRTKYFARKNTTARKAHGSQDSQALFPPPVRLPPPPEKKKAD